LKGLQLLHRFLQALISLLLVIAATAAGFLVADVGMTGIVMLYLLAVVAASYFLGFLAAVFAAVGSFLAINYFFVEPRYTFEVANAESWVALLGFLAVSVVVASLVKRLQDQTARAEQSRQRAECARGLSEQLAGLHDEHALLENGCRLIHEAMRLPTGIAVPDTHGDAFSLVQQCPKGTIKLDQRAAKWCCTNARTIGPGTENWPETGIWVMPFERLPGIFPVLVVLKEAEAIQEDEITYLRGLLDQLATAYQRVRNEQRAKDAEMRARQETVQNALLASVSHDMRTPLTAILGATTTLLRQRDALDDREQVRLLESVSAEAQHLANMTENILSLSRLETGSGRELALDWQSPEEIIGAVLQRYRNRPLAHKLRSAVPSGVALIEADAVLLSQALANLIDNALAAHRGEEPILVSAEEQDDKVSICVQDRGTGFPDDFRAEHIRKFYRADTHGKGMGLGLMIVQTIARLHHAELQITRRDGGGSCVALIFPAKHTGGNLE
jgi:two-component system, OmpR family, sensor histidine kinase KdpD